MKLQAISLWQPWASLIAIQAKTIETRSWAPPNDVIGRRIAIHAAKKWNRELLATCNRAPFQADLLDGGVIVPPLGVIVATAILKIAYRTPDERLSKLLDQREFAYGDYRSGRYGWVLAQIEALDAPIPWRGQQGFFPVEIPDEVVTKRAWA